ncbi:PREDICTED: dehydrogenase/reductase SDR family member on chromosome X-like [Polistes dominula]|uniref:Dehydrogenase/reductase SDR family member on chromosome X-like n=1 Tax=Polistes dominula TaxID=743375 RepID=A0ABM1IAY8_POLDO|nr:PREDICTED: dehydrogenase/reductase SDR family member on chromosome X-like [Polistes dominula]XP_015177376.1 PREDICTED: dehydrogenase/reductase SDR family member on chromosome X-like [Polistes dominula]
MFFLSVSMCAFLCSCLYYYKPRTDKHYLIIIYYTVIYSLVALKEMFYDRINAKNNKTALLPMPGKIAIITGGSRGIGSEVVRMLLQCDIEVIIACRTPSVGEKLISKIRESGVTTGKAKVYKIDNNSLESVKEFADKIKHDYNELHILINNAGIMFTPQKETKDGFDQQWSTNYLSHFYLTVLLLPLLKAGSRPKENSRIVNVSSCAHRIGWMNFDDINFKQNFNTYLVYAQSKLAQLISTKHLQDLFEKKQLGIQVYAVHPGIVNTNLFDYSYLKRLKFLNKYTMKTPEQGATSIVYAATNDKIKEHGGIYINNCIEDKNVNPLVYDKFTQEELLRISLEQVQLKDLFQFIDN